MNKALIPLCIVGFFSQSAIADSVRLVINYGKSEKLVASEDAKTSKDSTNQCVTTPDGSNQWCVAVSGNATLSKSAEQSLSSKPFERVVLPSHGYSASQVANALNQSGKFPLVEVDPWVTTPDSQPQPLPGNVSEQNSDDPQTGHQTRYLGNSEDLTLGMSVFQMWDEVDVRTKDNPVDVIVMDSSFFEASDMVYDDGRSFTTVPLVPGGSEQVRNDDFSPRQESIDAGICTGHGLGVAGTLAATIDNGVAGAGITNNVDVHAIRTMTCGSGFLSDTGDALIWLSGESFEGVTPYQGGPGIVNLSLSARIDECPTFMQSAINSARDAGFTVVVASSNNYTDTADFTPANCEGVTVVAALDRDGNRAAFSNVGEEVDFSVAGTDVVAPCVANEDGCFWEGTSFAAPLVTGIFAAIKQATGASNSLIEAALKLTAKNDAPDVGCEGGLCGGVPNAEAALALLSQVQQQDSSQIEFALSGNDTCEQTWFLDNFGASLSLCELYKVSFINAGALEGLSYQLLSTSDAGDWSSAIEIGTFEQHEAFVSDIDIENLHYGYRICNEDECLSDVISLNIDRVQDEFRPVGCN